MQSTVVITSNLLTMNHAAAQLANLGGYFQQMSSAFLLFTLVDFGLGILYCWDVLRGFRPMLQWVTYGFGFIELMLAIAHVVKLSLYIAAYYSFLRDDGRNRPPATSQLLVFSQVIMAYDIMMFIAAIATVGFSIYILVLANKRPNLDHHQVCTMTTS